MTQHKFLLKGGGGEEIAAKQRDNFRSSAQYLT